MMSLSATVVDVVVVGDDGHSVQSSCLNDESCLQHKPSEKLKERSITAGYLHAA